MLCSCGEERHRPHIRVETRRCVLSFFLLIQVRLPPDVTRILFVRNLPFKISAEELYEIFGAYGAVRQIRLCVLFNIYACGLFLIPR